MNRPIKRQLWLLNTLLRYKKLPFKEHQSEWKDSYLNDDDFELSLRTFHDHKDAIEEMFPVQIKCDSKDGYRYYVVKDSPKEQDSMLVCDWAKEHGYESIIMAYHPIIKLHNVRVNILRIKPE
jgi:hypothetical protein